MNRWIRVGFLSAVAASAQASVGGCVTGDIPAQHADMPEGGGGSSASGGAGGGQEAGLGDGNGAGGMSSGSGGASSGSGGTSGAVSGSGGASGAGGAGPVGGAAGAAATNGGSTTDGGRAADGAKSEAGSIAADGGSNGDGTCGALGQACCASGSSCGAGLTCLGSASCSCIQGLYDYYLLRVDGTLLTEFDSAAADQTPVLDATTAAPIADVTKAVGGNGYGCAIRGADKEAWCWRSGANGNNVGQLGSGVTDTSGPVFRATQVLIAANRPLTGVTDLFADLSGLGTETCAVVDGGQVYCWGSLTWLSNGGTGIAVAYATQITVDGVAPLTGVTHMAFGNNAACAVLQGAAAKEVWCWGANDAAQLGQGDMMNRRYPTKVLGLTNPSRVAVTDSPATVCAIDGANVRCWGSTASGGTGKTGSTILSPTLVLKTDGVTPLDGITDIRTVSVYNVGGFCALTASHIPLCWGSGFGPFPDVYVAPNLVALGVVSSGVFGATVRYLSNDGLYHVGSTSRMPNCGLLQ